MKITWKDIAQIAGKASSIPERLKSKSLISDRSSIDESVIQSRLQHWCQIVAKGNSQKFAKRLAWDNLNIQQISSVLDIVQLAENTPLPSWAETLTEVIEVSALISSETLIEKDIDSSDPIPFEDILIPFIQVARQKLKVQVGTSHCLLAQTAYQNIERSLLQHLSRLAAQTLQEEFITFRNFAQDNLTSSTAQTIESQPKKQYQEFIKQLEKDGLLSFFQKYSVLGRLLATATNFCVDRMADLIQRLAKDWTKIQQTFQNNTELGQVVELGLKLSDSHNQGGSVIALTFNSGLKLIYKPRDLGSEQAYFQFLTWLNQREVYLPFKVLKVINQSTHGWVEYVEQLPCEDETAAKRYYQRSGMLLCLLHALEGNDCHYENLIASGEHPILIDLETIPQHQVQNVEGQEDDERLQALIQQENNSILRTGLLPRWDFLPDGRRLSSVSGLGGFGEEEREYRQPKWQNINTDKMALGYQYVKLQHKGHLATLNGVILSPNDYVDEIVDGFRQMYQFLIEHRESILAPESPLVNLRGQQVRFLCRNTNVYSVLLKNTVNPKLVQNGADRSIELDILSRAFLSYDVKPYTWSLLDWEHQALDRLDIPHFITYSDSKDLIVNPNEIIKSFFKASGYDLMMSRLQYLNDEDLEQQIAIIRASLPSLVIVGKPINLSLSKSVNLDFDSVAILTTEAMVQKAIEIGVKIRQHATIIDGSASWIGLEYLPETGRFHLQPLAFGLEGFFGVALFLAALEKVTGEREFHDLALKALQPLHKILKNSRVCQHLIKLIGIGGKDGSGSIVYSLVQIAQLLGEPNLLEDAQQVASLITPDHIARDRDLDIVLGSAGAILGFLALYKVTANTDVLEKAIICGQHLLEHRVVSDTGYKAWMPIGNEKPLTGFSHGAAGIAYALLRLYETTLEPIFLDAATEAISYERSVFSSEAQNWPDFRPPATNNKQPSFTTSWCTGAPGIGLARLGSLAILDSPEIRQEIDVAVQTTQNFSQQGVDNVCCGNFGRIDVLIEAACRLSQPELLEIAHRKTSWLVTRAEQTGFFNLFPNLPQGIYHPNLFSGMAGIGYTLLKLAKPDLLPSVLLLE